MEEVGRKKSVEAGPSGAAPEFGPEGEPSRESESQPESVGAERGEQEVPPEPSLPSVSSAPSVPRAERMRDPLLIEVERELEENLWDVYRVMPQQQRLSFRQEGERVAQVIRDGLSAGKMTASSILNLIVRWLRMIPGVNSWFLTQEAKIKTDALMKVGREGSGSGI